MARVVHFEIHADDLERAIGFYRALLGWEFTKWGGPMDYHLIRTGPSSEPGIDGGLVKRQGGEMSCAVNAYVCTVGVENLDATMQAVTQHGGQIVVPRMPIPGVGWLAYAKDTEQNIFGMMQSDPAAA